MIGGMIVAFVITLKMLPENISFTDALNVAGENGKMKILDFSFDLNNRYTLWSGILGGFFLFMAYFATDQSQVGRYISGNSIKESRLGLIFNGLFKIPMQFFILLCGIMVFVFYQYNKAPIFFNEHTLDKVRNHTESSARINKIEMEYDQIFIQKQEILSNKTVINYTQLSILNDKEKELRKEVQSLIKNTDPNLETNDKDYVFIAFVLKYLPVGVIGLLLAVIFCAAMSSSSSEISALATCSTIDIYQNLYNKNQSEAHYTKVGKIFTLLWGIIIIAFANMCSLFENLIQFVNIIGSLFYGTILGIFVTGIFTKSISSKSVLIASLITECIIIVLYCNKTVEYLWLNPIGCFLVVGISFLIQKSKTQQ
jgi:Na+/proline symporter